MYLYTHVHIVHVWCRDMWYHMLCFLFSESFILLPPLNSVAFFPQCLPAAGDRGGETCSACLSVRLSALLYFHICCCCLFDFLLLFSLMNHFVADFFRWRDGVSVTTRDSNLKLVVSAQRMSLVTLSWWTSSFNGPQMFKLNLLNQPFNNNSILTPLGFRTWSVVTILTWSSVSVLLRLSSSWRRRSSWARETLIKSPRQSAKKSAGSRWGGRVAIVFIVFIVLIECVSCFGLSTERASKGL